MSVDKTAKQGHSEMIDYLHPENKSTVPWKEVKKLWQNLHSDPLLRTGLRPEIYDSWERSYQYKVDRNMREIVHVCSEAEFSRAKANSAYLMEIAAPVMKRLSEFVKGTGFLVALNDANCINLLNYGDKETKEWARHTNLVEGTVWTEEIAGTNSVPICISQVKPVSIYSYEHFCLYAITAASSFAPIVDNGRVLGCIGMVAPYQRVSHHTLGMAVAAADHIQSKLALNRISKYQQVITDSMSDGVMVVNSDGLITYINNKCSKIMGFASANVTGSSIHDLFGQNPENQFFINIVTQGRMVTDDLIILHNDKNQIRCHITCTPLHSSNLADTGSVIIVRESERINNIVGKWIGRGAQMTFDDIIGSNAKFKDIIKIARTTAQSNSNVLLMGESGTGKDIVAQAMHNESPRQNNPFVAINCAALPRELIASELFGYEEGAFTGAKKGGNIGKFELANQGTLFLDEIADMPLDLQSTLLRVLEEKSVMRLGGNQVIPVNVRIIAATNKNLEDEISRNRFRKDLYYRLGVIKLVIPPLRERRDDIVQLVNHFLKLISKRYGKNLYKISPLALQTLIAYDWPGNIRELQNVLEGAVQLSASEEIDNDFILNYLGLSAEHLQNAVSNMAATDFTSTEGSQLLEEILRKNKYNKRKTAQELGISRQTLYRHLSKYGLS